MQKHEYHYGDPSEDDEDMVPPRELAAGAPSMNGRTFIPLIPITRYKNLKNTQPNED